MVSRDVIYVVLFKKCWCQQNSEVLGQPNMIFLMQLYLIFPTSSQPLFYHKFCWEIPFWSFCLKIIARLFTVWEDISFSQIYVNVFGNKVNKVHQRRLLSQTRLNGVQVPTFDGEIFIARLVIWGLWVSQKTHGV